MIVSPSRHFSHSLRCFSRLAAARVVAGKRREVLLGTVVLFGRPTLKQAASAVLRFAPMLRRPAGAVHAVQRETRAVA